MSCLVIFLFPLVALLYFKKLFPKISFAHAFVEQFDAPVMQLPI